MDKKTTAKWVDQTHIGDARKLLRDMVKDKVQVQTCVTSPPYYGLRDYGRRGQIGLERSLNIWIRDLVDVFDQVHKILAPTGTLWLNLGDAYASSGGAGWQGKHGARANRTHTQRRLLKPDKRKMLKYGIRPKNLMGQPWRMAFALQEAGWYLRKDIIWNKPNPMPESVKDRPTGCHEYIFLMAKQPRYYYDRKAILEPASPETHARYARGRSTVHKYADGGPMQQTLAKPLEHMVPPNPFQRPIAGWADEGDHSAVDHAKRRAAGSTRKKAKHGSGVKNSDSMDQALEAQLDWRNKRSVWTVLPDRSPFAHFATFPAELIAPCILAGSKYGQIVLDPFMGSGTTAQCATNLGRHYIGCELNPEYVDIQKHHRDMTIGMNLR